MVDNSDKIPVNQEEKAKDNIEELIVLSKTTFPACLSSPEINTLIESSIDNLGALNQELLNIYGKIAELALQRNRFQDALKYSQLCEAIYEQNPNNSLQDRRANILRLVNLQTKLCKFEDASETLAKCSNLVEETDFKNVGFLSELKIAQATLFIELARYEPAIDILLEYEKLNGDDEEHQKVLLDITLLKVKAYEAYSMIKEMDESMAHATKLFDELKADGKECNYGFYYNTMGNYHDTRGLYLQAKESHKLSLQAILDSENKDLLTLVDSYIKLCDLYIVDGDSTTALKCVEEASRICTELVPKTHLLYAACLASFGRVYISQGDFNKAFQPLEESLQIRTKILGAQHPLLASSYRGLIEYYLMRTDYATAIEVSKKALEIQTLCFGKDYHHYSIAITYNGLGKAYFLQHQHNEAQVNINKAVEIMSGLFGDDHPLMADFFNNLSITYGIKLDRVPQLFYLTKAIGILKRMLGKEHIKLAAFYQNIAIVYSSTGKFNEAVKKSEKGIRIRINAYGRLHPLVGDSYSRLAMVYKNNAKYKEATKYFLEGLHINLRFYPITNKKYVPILVDLILSLKSIGNIEEAEKFAKMYYAIMKRLPYYWDAQSVDKFNTNIYDI